METVFEHNMTKEEMVAVMGFDDWVKEDFADWSQIDHYGLLYRLYTYRGDHETAKKFADLIPNTEHKMFGICYHDFAERR
ncbi:MAG: hypothetical protein IKR17_10325 [Bacteroidales bacterium]|nr:hypothetical protein [Bacteroidales bacterium]